MLSSLFLTSISPLFEAFISGPVAPLQATVLERVVESIIPLLSPVSWTLPTPLPQAPWGVQRPADQPTFLNAPLHLLHQVLLLELGPHHTQGLLLPSAGITVPSFLFSLPQPSALCWSGASPGIKHDLSTCIFSSCFSKFLTLVFFCQLGPSLHLMHLPAAHSGNPKPVVPPPIASLDTNVVDQPSSQPPPLALALPPQGTFVFPPVPPPELPSVPARYIIVKTLLHSHIVIGMLTAAMTITVANTYEAPTLWKAFRVLSGQSFAPVTRGGAWILPIRQMSEGKECAEPPRWRAWAPASASLSAKPDLFNALV